ncbi:MAG: hypothetical protein K0U52_11665 [Gammaproteobacteria bacterium]|nr:hypothetical protein [Gammaproteobacteria bacterium]
MEDQQQPHTHDLFDKAKRNADALADIVRGAGYWLTLLGDSVEYCYPEGLNKNTCLICGYSPYLCGYCGEGEMARVKVCPTSPEYVRFVKFMILMNE